MAATGGMSLMATVGLAPGAICAELDAARPFFLCSAGILLHGLRSESRALGSYGSTALKAHSLWWLEGE